MKFPKIYQDYSNTLQESQYVRYIQKWNLVKKDPFSPLSEPVEPIVYWIENTVPEEFRDAIREGIEAWNIAFEAIGFKNAIVAKQMPDDATWDPADIRYNTIILIYYYIILYYLIILPDFYIVILIFIIILYY